MVFQMGIHTGPLVAGQKVTESHRRLLECVPLRTFGTDQERIESNPLLVRITG